MSHDWRVFGACNSADPELFFSDDGEAAKLICLGCPVLGTCRDFSVVNKVEGVWGAMTEGERRRYRKQWTQEQGPALAEKRRQHQVEDPNRANAQQSREARAARRLKQARIAYERLGQHSDHENYSRYRRVLELVLAHPTVNTETLAARLDRSPAWFNTMFREVCKLTA